MKENNNKILYFVIAILIIIVLVLGGIIVSNELSKKDTPKANETSKQETPNDKPTNSDTDNKPNKDDSNNQSTDEPVEVIKNKMKFSEYCYGTSCNKELGKVLINDKEVSLSVDLQNINTKNISGTIKLGDKTLNTSELEFDVYGHIIDGFEVYDNYLIIYTSSDEPTILNGSKCEVKSFYLYIFNSSLEEVSGLSGYTKNNGFDDFKIVDDYLYYYGLSTNQSTHYASMMYEKIRFNDLVSRNYNKSEQISKIDSCYSN